MKYIISLVFLVAPLIASSWAQQDQQCSDDEFCEYFIEDSKCDNGTCLCKSDVPVISDDGTKCLAVAAGYGGSCSENLQCSTILGAGGVCRPDTKLCECSAAYHYLKGKCWKSVPLDGSCFLDEQCYAAFDFTGLECQSGKCSCRSEFYRRAGACRRMNKMGDPCMFDSDCTCEGGEGKCPARVCQCPARSYSSQHQVSMAQHSGSKQAPCDNGFYEKDQKCVPEIGSGCESDDACSSGATAAICIDKRACGCDSLRIRAANNRACSKVTGSINTACGTNEACVPFGVNSVCAESGGKKICQCNENSHFDTSVNYCVSNRLIGDTCDEDSECFTTSGQHVTCLDHKCSCVQGTHPADSGRDCRPDAMHVGDGCLSDTDCGFENAACNMTSQQCVCQNGFFASSPAGEKCLKGVGANCNSDADCDNVAGTHCSEDAPHTCTCQDGFISSANFSACLPLKPHGESCQQDNQCDPSMGDLRECKNGICTCQDQSQFLFIRCYLIKKLGEKCKARAECIYPGEEDKLDKYICQNGICSCQYGSSRYGDRCV